MVFWINWLHPSWLAVVDQRHVDAIKTFKFESEQIILMKPLITITSWFIESVLEGKSKKCLYQPLPLSPFLGGLSLPLSLSLTCSLALSHSHTHALSHARTHSPSSIRSISMSIFAPSNLFEIILHFERCWKRRNLALLPTQMTNTLSKDERNQGLRMS